MLKGEPQHKSSRVLKGRRGDRKNAYLESKM